MTKNPRDVSQPDATKIREDIQRTRQQLGDTVEALARKADVPARAKEKAAEVRDTAKAKAAVAKDAVMAKADQAMHAASDASEHAVDKLPQPVAQRANRVIAAIRQRPAVFVAGAIVSIVLLRRVVFRKR
jgi:hypothetical protein